MKTKTTLMYGTAWKEEETRRLVGRALEAGFRAIDTANQRKHYDEAAVGAALQDAYGAGLVRREDLFLQTKFTHRDGQDHRLPYDPAAPVGAQVEQSFASSLAHLGTTWLDSYVLHGPSVGRGLAPEDVEAWRAMEALHRAGGVKTIGVSNVTDEQLARLLDLADVAPSFVQNRCHARTGWDHAVRDRCADQGIVYQGFSLLTANRPQLARPSVRAVAARLGITTAQLVFRFALDVGMLPLTGTTSDDHMREDLEVLGLPPLSSADARVLAELG